MGCWSLVLGEQGLYWVYVHKVFGEFSGMPRVLETFKKTQRSKKHRVRMRSSVHWFLSVGALDEVECSDGVPGLGPWIGVY